MNGTWDVDKLNVGSIGQDTLVCEYKPEGMNPYWTYFKRLAASQGNTFETLPTDQNIAYDEIHPQEYSFQTPAAAAAWATRVTQVVLVAVEWSFNPQTEAVVAALLAANNPLVKIVQEFFYFGPTGDCTDPSVIDWYDAACSLRNIIPCYIVSDSWHKSELYAKACSINLGLKTAFDVNIMKRFIAREQYGAFQWGLIYPNNNDYGVSGPGRAMKSWDMSVFNTIF